MHDQVTLGHRSREINAYPDIARTARLYNTLLPVLAVGTLPVLSGKPSDEEAKALLEQGRHLLTGRNPDVDARPAMDLLFRLAAAAEQSGEPASAAGMRQWFDQAHHADPGAAFEALLSENDLDQGMTDNWDRDVGRFLARVALGALLASWGKTFAPLAGQTGWNRNLCFLCGSGPVFAELQDNGQEKHLRCGLCGADWRVSRLSCTHCGNDDHRMLPVLFMADEPAGPRIEACDRCLSYLKVIPAFSPTPADLLAVKDLATFDLDAVAAEQGYRRAPEH